MSNPFSQLQAAARTRHLTPAAADSQLVVDAINLIKVIPIELEEKGDITERINRRLTQKAIQAGTNSKIGLAFLIITPKGRAGDGLQTQAQVTTIRVSLFCKPPINNGPSGFQIAPLDAFAASMRAMITWNRGPGAKKVCLRTWDSLENTNGEISYFADYDVPHVIPLE